MGANLAQLLAAGERSFSFEFFPPADAEGEERLWSAIRSLERLRPTFVSVTYGAGGSTRDRTVRITREISSHTDINAVAHLTCVGSSVDDLRGIAGQYMAAGIENVLALRGDPPGGPSAPWQVHPGGLNHADQLVELLKSLGELCVGVAAYPNGHPASGGDFDRDVDALVKKAEAGAQFAITQFFFESESWVRLVKAARDRGCTIPIIPGIMPVTSVKQLKRFAELQGSSLPEQMVKRFDAIADDPNAVRDLGVEIAAELCRELLAADAPGIHFFTLNASTATKEVFEMIHG